MALLSPTDRIRIGARRVVRGVYGKPMDVLEDLGEQTDDLLLVAP